MELLSRALEAAGRGDRVAYLAALLEAWRALRDPELAALVERLGAALPARPLPRGPLAKTLRASIATATDVEVSAIVAIVMRELRTMPRLWEVLVELAAARPADPRIASALAQIVEE